VMAAGLAWIVAAPGTARAATVSTGGASPATPRGRAAQLPGSPWPASADARQLLAREQVEQAAGPDLRAQDHTPR
jgi:hypothetical protein